MKVFTVAIIATLVLLVGGMFAMTRNNDKPSSSEKVSNEILIPRSSYQTSPNATVTLVEFGDYQCPACGDYYPLVKKLTEEFGDKLNFVFRNFPLTQHKNANISALATEAAGLQGKFWEMHDKIYETQDKWSNLTPSDAKNMFEGFAKDLKLDTEEFRNNIMSLTLKTKIENDVNDGRLAKITSTPTFFLNGEKLNNPGSFEDFETLIKAALVKNPITQNPSSEKYHAHFDLKVYLNGKAVDLSLPQYQSTEDKELDPDIHVHDGNGKVVHLHAKNITLKRFFDSIKLTILPGTKGYVNGKLVDNILEYVPQDLDRIVVGNGPIDAVSNDACIYSEKCPERGKPPTEACVGGLGTGCEE
ncbi:MAG TPA: thioredoxin domain-containing protein [Alphaproteobacteria bacterium]|jgi:protein-disulfide isomerase|nr:thioredoxin domain-containing protein [Alphaproteobacteria bacterium]